MKTIARISVIACCLGALLPMRSVLAARTATVDAQLADLLETPDKHAKVIEKISKGTVLTISNQPIRGFFKTRSPSGQLGWIDQGALILPAGEPVYSMPEEKSSSAEPVESRFRTSGMIRMLGGGDYFQLSDVSQLLGTSNLRLGVHYGGEFSLRFRENLAAVLRVERLSKAAVARDSLTLKTYENAVSSTPILLGVEMAFLRKGRWLAHGSAMLGAGLNTSLETISLNDPPPNRTVTSGSAFAAMLKADMNYIFPDSKLALYFELGYRYLKTGKLVPGSGGASDSLYVINGEYVPFSIDMSGPFGGIGVAWAI